MVGPPLGRSGPDFVKTPPRRVLIVGFRSDVRRNLRVAFESAGHSIVEVATGAAALDHLFSNAPAPHAILVDTGLPPPNGDSLVAVLRSYTRLSRIPVIRRKRGESAAGVVRAVEAALADDSPTG